MQRRRSRQAPPAGPSRSSRTRDTPRQARRTARRAPPASADSAAPPRAPACWCSSPAPAAPAPSWRDRATQEVVGNPVGELADDVGRARRDEQQRDAVGDRDVLDVRVHARPPLRRDHRPPRDRLEGHGTRRSASRTASSRRRRRGRASGAHGTLRRPCRRRCRR